MAGKHILGAAAARGTPQNGAKPLKQAKAKRIKLSGARPAQAGAAPGFNVRGQPKG